MEFGEPRLCQLRCNHGYRTNPPQTQGLETTTIFILLTDLQFSKPISALWCQPENIRGQGRNRHDSCQESDGKVVPLEAPGAITAVGTCPRGAPFQDGFLMTYSQGLCNSFRKMIRILTATVSTIFYHLRKLFPSYLVNMLTLEKLKTLNDK